MVYSVHVPSESVVTNAVDRVLGECEGGIYPHIKLYYNVLGIDNVMPL